MPLSLRRNSLFPFIRLLRLRYLSSSSSSDAAAAANGGTSPPNRHSTIDYLVNFTGLTDAQAAKASKHLALKTSEKLDAVLTFMRSQGFREDKLKKLVSLEPRVLRRDVEKDLAPKFRFLRDLGFSKSGLVDAILAHPSILILNVDRCLLPKLKMWESLFGSRELLLAHLKGKCWFLSSSIENVIRPNLKFLVNECGIPEERVSVIVKIDPSILTKNPNSLRALVVRAEELGVPRESSMFIWTLNVLSRVSKDKVQAHAKLTRSFGWSETDFYSAIRKVPFILGSSQEILRKKFDFYVNKVGYTPSFIAKRPILLKFSMEKRVIPRFRVMEKLKSEDLWTPKHQRLSFFMLSSTKFVEKFVIPYKHKVPELLDLVN